MNTNILKLIFNTLEEAIVILDEQLNIIFANERFYSITETTEADVMGKNLYCFEGNIFDVPLLKLSLESLPQTEKFENAAISIKFKDGRTKLLQVTAYTHQTPIDKNIILNFHEITNQKYTDEQLIKLNKAVSASEDIIFMTDCDGKFTFINPQFTKEYGYTEDEVIGIQTPRILKSGKMNPTTYKTIWNNLKQNKNATGEFVNKTKNGDLIIVDFSANPILDESDKLIGFLAIQKNITERKKADEALIRSEEKYRKFFEDDLTADFILDMNGKILSCNPAYVNMFGFDSIEAACEENFYNLFPYPDKLSALKELIKKQNQVKNYEIELRRKDDKRIIVIGNLFNHLDEHDNIIHLHGYLFDDTRRKILESHLLQAQKMQSIGTLAGGIAHDFNNVLGTILGHSEIALKKISETHPLYSHINIIIQLTNRAARIVRQLLAFSRRQIIEPAVINLNTLISDLLKLIGKTIGEHIEIEFLPNKDANKIFADTAQIEQVIMNLCMNARDAMPDGGKLFIETENIVLDEDYVRGYPGAKPGKYVLLAFTDTGCGISAPDLDRIFEPFFTTKDKNKGTGLGLAMVHGIVYQHNGIINVYSEVSKGTTFKIYFPASECESVIQVKDEQKELPIGTENILLVEDDVDLREMISSILMNQGYTVIAAADGEQAVEVFTRNASNIDFIISDVVMPKVSGKEFYNRVRILNPDIGFLFISGYTANVIHKNFLVERGFDFLQKPFTPYELAFKIRKILDKNI